MAIDYQSHKGFEDSGIRGFMRLNNSLESPTFYLEVRPVAGELRNGSKAFIF